MHIRSYESTFRVWLFWFYGRYMQSYKMQLNLFDPFRSDWTILSKLHFSRHSAWFLSRSHNTALFPYWWPSSTYNVSTADPLQGLLCDMGSFPEDVSYPSPFQFPVSMKLYWCVFLPISWHFILSKYHLSFSGIVFFIMRQSHRAIPSPHWSWQFGSIISDNTTFQ